MMVRRSRREFLKAAVVGGVAALARPRLVLAAPAFSWKRFAGTQLRFVVPSYGWTNDVIRPELPQFESLTGMKVTWEVYPEDAFRQKLTIEMSSGSGALDGFMSLTAYDGFRFAKAGWYEPLEPYVSNSGLTEAQYDFKDFYPSLRGAATINGKLIGVPTAPEVQLLYYRTDLFQARGLILPKTLQELESDAKALTNKGDNVYGFLSRGKRAAAVYTFAPFLLNFGGHWLDAAGAPTLDTLAFINALAYYGRLLREYGPPGGVNVGFYEVNDLMAQGRAAMATASNYTVGVLENPEKSKIAGKVGYAPIPAGPAGTHSPLVTWVHSISSQSKHKEAAWYFTQWATSKEMMLRSARTKTPVGRISVWDSAVFQSSMPKGWLGAVNVVLASAYPNQINPQVASVPEVRDVIGAAIVAVIEGGDARQAAATAQAQVADIIKRAG